ncbi:MAG: SDR family NAD(P)-dependent oxidoreductase [Solirubrobacterales bacterium]|nr:SDR family NAD(P)-dependent oxidoreductase [Solirubrobacterales bacterium]
MLDPALNDRVALVTGASGGIGRAIARGLAAEGAAVACGYGANGEPAQRLAAEIVDGGGRAVALGADLRDAAAGEALVARTRSELGEIDVLVNNAGLGSRRTWEETTLDEFDEAYAVNVRAAFALAQLTLPGMRDRGFGRVLMMSSVAGLTGGIVGPHYAAAKSALHGLTHFLAGRLAGAGVTVNALAPALVKDTGMLPGDPGELARRIPVGRLGRPGEVADLALAVLRNGYITSQVISVDGGMYPH